MVENQGSIPLQDLCQNDVRCLTGAGTATWLDCYADVTRLHMQLTQHSLTTSLITA